MKKTFKQIILIFILQFIIINIAFAATTVRSTHTLDGAADPVFSSTTLVYKSKEYICDSSVALDPDYWAANLMTDDYPMPWADIAQYITEAHSAQGFIDLFVHVDMTPIVKLAVGVVPTCYVYGDPDDRSKHDLVASVDGALYDMIDTDCKGVWDTSIISGAMNSNQYIVFRFAVPSWVPKSYRVFLGQSNLKPARSSLSYSDRYVVKVYTPILSTGPYACPDILVPRRYKSEYNPSNRAYDVPKMTRSVTKNVPVTFDASKSTDTSGASITKYEWDLDGDGIYDLEGMNPVYTFRSTGTYTINLKITTSDNKVSIASGTVNASNLIPLPLTITVVEAPAFCTLYQNAPNPFITSKSAYTTFNYDIKENAFVTLKIYTASGELVKTLVDESRLGGLYSASWDGTNEDGKKVASGVYIYNLKAGSSKDTKIMAVVK